MGVAALAAEHPQLLEYTPVLELAWGEVGVGKTEPIHFTGLGF